MVDFFTKATCFPPTDSSTVPEGTNPITESFSCALEAEKKLCREGGGTCHVQRDGYYVTNVIFILIAAALFWGFIQRKALQLEALPVRSWRIHGSQRYSRVSNGGG